MPKDSGVKVAIALQLNEESLKAVQDVSLRLDVLSIGEEVRQERQLQLDGQTNSAEYRQAERLVDEALGDAEVVLCSYLSDRLFERAPKLRWIQCSAAGIDQWITRETWLIGSSLPMRVGRQRSQWQKRSSPSSWV